MIRSFRSKGLKKYWTKNDASGLPADHLSRLKIRLSALDAATSLAQMNVPGWALHPLSGSLAGRYALKVTGNWRLTFAWDQDGPSALDVDYEDYH